MSYETEIFTSVFILKKIKNSSRIRRFTRREAIQLKAKFSLRATVLFDAQSGQSLIGNVLFLRAVFKNQIWNPNLALVLFIDCIQH